MQGGVKVSDYVATWRTAYNQIEAGYLPGECQLLAMFVNGLPMNSILFVTLYDNVLNNSVELPDIQHIFDHALCIKEHAMNSPTQSTSLSSSYNNFDAYLLISTRL